MLKSIQLTLAEHGEMLKILLLNRTEENRIREIEASKNIMIELEGFTFPLDKLDDLNKLDELLQINEASNTEMVKQSINTKF